MYYPLENLNMKCSFHYLPRPVTLTIHVSHRQHEELQVTIWNWKSFQHSTLLHLSPLPILVMALIDEQLDFILTKHVSYNALKFLVLGVFFSISRSFQIEKGGFWKTQLFLIWSEYCSHGLPKGVLTWDVLTWSIDRKIQDDVGLNPRS